MRCSQVGGAARWIAWIPLVSLCACGESDRTCNLEASVALSQGTVRGYTVGAIVRSQGVVTFTDASGDERIILRCGATVTSAGGRVRDNGISAITLDGDVVTVTAWNSTSVMSVNEVLSRFASSHERLEK